MSSDEEKLLLLLAVKNKKKKRRCWVHETNQKRNQLGEYQRLCIELESHEDRFYKYFRMSRDSFEELHDLIKLRIEKFTTNWRAPIGTRERLAICLRYLATGDSYLKIAVSFRLGRSTVSNIVDEVCREISNILQPTYLPKPTEEIWKTSQEGFSQLWGFPNCIGSIDEKHVEVKSQNNSGSQFFGHNSNFSLVLLAVVDPHHKFLIADIESYGRYRYSGIFENSAFFREYVDGKTILPPMPLPGTDTPIPHVLVGDESFALQTYLMRPYPMQGVINNPRKKLFNANLSGARRVVENAYGILAMKWRIFLRPIKANIESAEHIVKAACCLHNYVIVKDNNREWTAAETEEECGPIRAFLSSESTNRRSPIAAIQVRECFADYFERRNNAT